MWNKNKSMLLLLALFIGTGGVLFMANKYCNLQGGDKIKDTYTDINTGFDGVDADVSALDGRVDTIITTPAEGVTAQEIIDARKGKPTLGGKIDEIDAHLAEIVQQQEVSDNKLIHTFSSRGIRKITDNFISGDNWLAKTSTGASASEWISENYMAKPNPANTEHYLWNKDKLQDGRICITWENPKINGSEGISTAIFFRGKDFKNFYNATFFSSGSNANKVRLYKVVDGVWNTITTITLSTSDVAILDGVPLNLEVSFYGSKLFFIVNGKTILSTTMDREFNIGLFGFGVTETTTATSNLNTLLSNFIAEEKKYDIYSTDIKNVLVVGDSIARETGATEGNGWIDLFEVKGKLISPNLVITRIPEGGKNSLEVLNEQIIPELNANPTKYDMVIVSCGTNNTRIDGTKRRTYTQSLADFAAMIKCIKNVNAIPILCTPPNFKDDIGIVYPTTHGADSYSLLGKIANGIRLISGLENVRLVDNYALLNNDWTKLADGVHPNDSGYALMSDNLYNTIFKQ